MSTLWIARLASFCGPPRPRVRTSFRPLTPRPASTENPEALFSKASQELFICPITHGGKAWTPGAYNPNTNVMYFPLQNTCAKFLSLDVKPWTTSMYGIRETPEMAPGS